MATVKVIKPGELPQYFAEEVIKSTQRRSLEVSEETKVHLVRLLTDFISPKSKLWEDNENHWDESVTLMLKACSEEPVRKLQQLRYRQLGDICLMRTGFFYDTVRQHGEGQVAYVMDVGINAYTRLANISPFQELSDRFRDLSMVIADLHLPELDKEENFLDLLKKWMETGDERYASLLSMKDGKYVSLFKKGI